MRVEAHDQHCPAPVFEANGFFTAIFYPNPEVRTQAGTMGEAKVTQHPPSTPQVFSILKAAASGAKTREELQAVAEIRDRKHFRKQYLEALLLAEFIERTIPDKPRRPKQRYRTTAAGCSIFENSKKES